MECNIIIVTHDSGSFLPKTIDCIEKQTLPPTKIIIVDTGSKDLSYLEPYRSRCHIEVVIAEKEIGFCRGNNIGMNHLTPNCEYVFFLNPDAFITPNYLEKAISYLDVHKKCGAITGTTLGYNINKDQPTGLYDTTGIFQKWYGKWYDRGQGEKTSPEKYQKVEEIPAICGAVFFCRKEALDTVKLRDSETFDSSFYMYKEDIDLSLRLRKQGWRLIFHPQLLAYHCRGWNPNRHQVPRLFRLCSARNELRINFRQFSPINFFYSFIKYFAVKLLNL